MQVFPEFITRRRLTLATLAVIASLAAVGFGLFRAYVYTVPLVLGDNTTAASAGVGDADLARYNRALQLFQAGYYELARDEVSQAYSLLAEGRGSIGPGQLKLAADMQFLLGLSYEKTKQKSSAIEAYKQALRHNPTLLDAKFNLERLIEDQSKSGGSGGADNKPGPSTGGQSNKGKGI
jgi:tetratricopeptide (TPR) repeat protein